ncbi:hypothetical protein ACHAXA_003356 [Cyclostephanos tholiformis]|uniref:Amine oxidase domain-containing protein n=1 Tax=Cyclostephanos tholiformis TaxID=382380 RepID=A0ABD3RE10_9STRA
MALPVLMLFGEMSPSGGGFNKTNKIERGWGQGRLAGGYGTRKNRPVEAGIHGFWREYRNTFDIMRDHKWRDEEEGGGGGYDGDNRRLHCRMTNLTTNFNDNEETIRRLIISNLPPPLDLPILAMLENTDKKTWRILRFVDLLSGLGSLGSWADFVQESRTSWMNYDAMPASLLFERAGITIALYDELVSPLLSVSPMCPSYDCSAAAALSCFHVFALQSRGAFDVRWCRGRRIQRRLLQWEMRRGGGGGIDPVAVLEVDFYRANSFVDLDDERIVDLALRALSAALGTEKVNVDDTLQDAVVLRARDAVSHFCPNSARYSPDVKLGHGLYICGDWVDRTGHASRSTKESVVTARQAASALSRDFGLRDTRCVVIPAARDTAQLSALRKSARILRSILPPKDIPPSPWVFAKQILPGGKDP